MYIKVSDEKYGEQLINADMIVKLRIRKSSPNILVIVPTTGDEISVIYKDAETAQENYNKVMERLGKDREIFEI